MVETPPFLLTLPYMENKMDISFEIDMALDKYESAIERQVSAEIDAGCCRTSRDWDNAHNAQDEAIKARVELERVISQEITLTKKMYQNFATK